MLKRKLYTSLYNSGLGFVVIFAQWQIYLPKEKAAQQYTHPNNESFINWDANLKVPNETLLPTLNDYLASRYA